MKTEPETFSLTDLQARPQKKEYWDGVRNYQARNFMRDSMRIGDGVLFYHSSCDPAGVVGEAKISALAIPDPSALNPDSTYFDPKATLERNPWVMVQVEFVKAYKRMVTLSEIKTTPGLEEILVAKRGMRLSIQPVTEGEFRIIKSLGAG